MDNKQVKNVYCDFTKTTAAGSTIKYFGVISFISTFFHAQYKTLYFSFFLFVCQLLQQNRVAENDRYRRREIGARPFPRPEKFSI
jgi:uncharacterized Tic20 family protein